jgi:hypothetical protein
MSVLLSVFQPAYSYEPGYLLAIEQVYSLEQTSVWLSRVALLVCMWEKACWLARVCTLDTVCWLGRALAMDREYTLGKVFLLMLASLSELASTLVVA